MSTRRAVIKRGVEAILAGLLAALFLWFAFRPGIVGLVFQWYFIWLLIDTRLSRSTAK